MTNNLLILGAGSFSVEVEELARINGFTDIAFIDDIVPSAIGTMKDIGKIRDLYDMTFLLP